jgi:ankyrin repeat protein
MGAHAQNFEPDDILYAATPLNLAVLNGNEDIVRALLDAGADLNKKDGRGR